MKRMLKHVGSVLTPTDPNPISGTIQMRRLHITAYLTKTYLVSAGSKARQHQLQ